MIDFQSAFIRGYPSAVYSLATWIIDNNITVPFSMKGIQLTSERVFEYQISVIEKTFNTKVFMQYGHTETCSFGYTYDESHCYKTAPLYGNVELECIYGRTQDFVCNYKKEKVLLTAIVFGLHYQAFNHIVRWQLEQSEHGKIVAYIVPSCSYTHADEEEIGKIFKEQVGIDVEFVYVDTLNLTER